MTDTDVDGEAGTPSEAALVADLREVAARDDTDDPPTTADVREYGTHAPREYRGAFGSFAAALDAADLRGRRFGPDADTLREDLRRVADREDTSDPPTVIDYRAHGEWAPQTAVNHLGDGSWADALDAARVPGRHASDGPDADALRADLREVAAREDTGDPPTTADYDAHGEWSSTTVADYLGDGSWGAALDAAGLDGDAARDRGPGPAVNPDALREDVRRVAAREDTSDPPTRADYDAHGEWSATTAVRRLGGDGHSWPAALDDAGLDGDAPGG